MFLSDVGEIDSTMFHSSNLSSVTRLKIDDAGITGIAEGAFSSFQNLSSLSLNRNAVTQVNSHWFGRPTVLNELSLTENLIEVVNEVSLSGLTGLTKLSLNKNRIRTIAPNSFSSQTSLAELDLSENNMSRVSPGAFRSLKSTRIRLNENPWDCSCEAQDSVDTLKDLWNRSLLDPQGVTCGSPAPLKGQPLWNVSSCALSTTPGSPSGTPTFHHKPTGALTTLPASSAQPTSDTQNSVRPTESLSTVTSNTAASPPSETEPSVHPRPTDVPITPSPQTEATEPLPNTNTVCTLAVVIGKNQVTAQNETETQVKYADAQSANEEAERIQLSEKNFLSEKNEKQEDADGDMAENHHSLATDTETVPYLSIGANPHDPNKQSTVSPDQRSRVQKVIGRVSTWPPTAIQWQARCKMKDMEEKRSDVLSVWTQSEMFKFSDEVANDKTTSFSETHNHTDMRLEEKLKAEEMIQDTIRETPNQNRGKLHDSKPAEKPPHQPTSKSSKDAEQRNEAKGAGTSRQRGENQSSGPKAASGGASPDDDTLLSGNEYAFMDLLHEVVQNNGRWTRERWKQIHVNKQRR
ncbi:hypothetical protein Q5P01_015175 [Channa striata]|uniref:LRRCT domain-containing protein n=1 Tax=Channa striata TaxID=64152 RepID=A0AA88MJL5_CHASR|nr:hypothetical protein Q5P01_015175 [Channa striata]